MEEEEDNDNEMQRLDGWPRTPELVDGTIYRLDKVKIPRKDCGFRTPQARAAIKDWT